ncbi:hypothetical protein [Leeia sp.]|uniref:hypothetical protein n=1 Tax=Leeia sp. TaxID=2884678 RepID=UPI0035AFE36E
MIFLALTPTGLQEALTWGRPDKMAIWCGSDTISGADYAELEYVNVSRLDYPLAGDPDAVRDAMATIVEHHPGMRIWVEQMQYVD